ncbi:putative Integral membrane protein [Seiridium cardinale]
MARYIEVEQGGLEYLLNSDQQRNSTSDRLNTTSFFYTMLEAGIALIAVNLPSLRIISTSTKPGEVVRTVRNLIVLSFLRSSSSNIDASQPATTSGFQEHGNAGSFGTRPSES